MNGPTPAPIGNSIVGALMFGALLIATVVLLGAGNEAGAALVFGFGSPFVAGVLGVKVKLDRLGANAQAATDAVQSIPDDVEERMVTVIKREVPPMIGTALMQHATTIDMRDRPARPIKARKASSPAAKRAR